MSEVLVLYYSVHGATEALAREVCAGVDAVQGMSARLRTVPAVSAVTESVAPAIPDSGPPYASATDIVECAGLVVGSPAQFGNMAAALKHFFDGLAGEWMAGSTVSKPAGLFTSSSSLHGGQETTLLTMAVPLLHLGMLICGIPYTEPSLSSTTTGGTPYGASHVTWRRTAVTLSADERRLAQALGKRVAGIAKKLTA